MDPRFDFSPYNVTPISYQHNPTMIGPVLLNEKKTQSMYLLFGGALKSFKPELNNLMAFGADDKRC